MRSVGATGRETALKLACLAVSIGLHAGLGSMDLPGFEPTRLEGGPMIVALVERPSTASLHAAPAASSTVRAKTPSAAPSRRASLPPAATPVTSAITPARTAEPLCAVPETPVADTGEQGTPAAPEADARLPSGGEAASGGSLAIGDGAGSGSGSGAQGLERKGDGGGGNLIKATPRYESNPLPNYPRLARQNRWEGTVRLRARVTSGGKVEGVALERSSGHDVLDRSALAGVKRWRFIPATRGGVPVACEVSIPVAFRLTE